MAALGFRKKESSNWIIIAGLRRTKKVCFSETDVSDGNLEGKYGAKAGLDSN